MICDTGYVNKKWLKLIKSSVITWQKTFMLYIWKLCVCVQAERKTEEHYKKQHTAVFKSATERLALSLLAKVRLLPSTPSASLASTPSFYFHKWAITAVASDPQCQGSSFPTVNFLWLLLFFFLLMLIYAEENRS